MRLGRPIRPCPKSAVSLPSEGHGSSNGPNREDPFQALTLISCVEDSQGEGDRARLHCRSAARDPRSERLVASAGQTFEGPQRLGAYLRSTEWRTATAADRKLFQAPFRAGIRLDSYQLLPLAKALELPRVNLLIGDDVGLGKTVEAGLIVRELLLRRRVDLIVVSAPASMLLQWQDGLAQKFGLDFTIVDQEPICAEHSEGSEEYPLQGAACHACLLVPETSCEARNTRLDRGLLTKTVLGDGFPLLS